MHWSFTFSEPVFQLLERSKKQSKNKCRNYQSNLIQKKNDTDCLSIKNLALF